MLPSPRTFNLELILERTNTIAREKVVTIPLFFSPPEAASGEPRFSRGTARARMLPPEEAAREP